MTAQGETAFIVRRLRSDRDYRPAPLDLRLAIPAVSLWVALLVAGNRGERVALVVSVGFALVAALAGGALGWLHRSQARRDRRGTLTPIRVGKRNVEMPGCAVNRYPETPGRAGKAGAVMPARRRHRLFPRGSGLATLMITALVIAIVFGTLALRLELDSRDNLAVIGAQPTARFDVKAQVVSTPKLSWRDSYRVDLKATRLTWHGSTYPTRALLQVKGAGWEGIPLGSWVRLRTGLASRDLSTQYLGYAKSPTPPEIIGPPTGRFVFVNAVRQRLREATAELSESTAGMIMAMSLGLTAVQDPLDRESMQVAGLSHLTAVSGMHLSVVLAVALGLTARKRRGVQVVVAAGIMGIFLAMLEGSASVTRAAAMGVLTLVGLGIARPSRSLSSLSAAIIGMLLVQPFQATSWGFALSVVATGAIVTGGPYLAAWCARFLPRLIALPLAVSLSAQLACAPLMLVMRGKLQVYSLPANLLTGGVSSIVTVGGLGLVALAALAGLPAASFAVIAMPVRLLEQGTAHVTGWAAAWIAGVARFFASRPGAEVDWLENPAAGVTGLLIVALSFTWVASQLARARRWRIGTPPRPWLPGRIRDPAKPLLPLRLRGQPPGWLSPAAHRPSAAQRRGFPGQSVRTEA